MPARHVFGPRRVDSDAPCASIERLMSRILAFGGRLLPALLVASAVVLLAAGMVAWIDPGVGARGGVAAAEPRATDPLSGDPMGDGVEPPRTHEPDRPATPKPTPRPEPTPRPTERPTDPPEPTERPTPEPTPEPRRHRRRSRPRRSPPGRHQRRPPSQHPSRPHSCHRAHLRRPPRRLLVRHRRRDHSATPAPTPVPTPTAEATPRPTPTPAASPAPVEPVVATRIVIASRDIDLPIISRDKRVKGQGPDKYPPCDVALYHTAFEQPGEAGHDLHLRPCPGRHVPAVAHASTRRNGASLIGALVQVYTSDEQEHVYQITRSSGTRWTSRSPSTRRPARSSSSSRPARGRGAPCPSSRSWRSRWTCSTQSARRGEPEAAAAPLLRQA